jgi:hypothetical protein
MAAASEKRLTVERLREVIAYDQETGLFTWRVTLSPIAQAGKQAGCTRSTRGYRKIRIDGRLFPAHRLAWLYVTGRWPVACIDHRNLDPSDNRFDNLREATPSQNMFNMRGQKSAFPLKGVHRGTVTGKAWRSCISAGKKAIHLGSFDCPAAAHFAYVVAADKLHGEFARAA